MTDEHELRRSVVENLARAGVFPDDAETTLLVHLHAFDQAGAELLYAVEDARYEVPALLFAVNPCVHLWPEPPPG